MKHRILGYLLSVILLTTFVPLVGVPALAEDSYVVEYYDVIDEITNYEDLTPTASYKKEDTILQGGSLSFPDHGTLRLLDDLTVVMKYESISSTLTGWIPSGLTIDLNGHTLTFQAPSEVTSSITMGNGIMTTKKGCNIKNGTIVIDAPQIEANIGLFAITISTDGGNYDFENVSILSTDGTELNGGIIFMQSNSSPMDDDTITLTNCTVDLGETAPVVGTFEMSGKIVSSGTTNVVSGSYRNLSQNSGDDTNKGTAVSVSGTPLNNVPGVAEGISVITSSETTAIIVQDGNAYLYDTLQEAVDAAAKRATGTDDTKKAEILVLKTPESNTTITLPEELNGVQVSVTGINSDIYLDDVKFETSKGETVEIGTDGVLTVNPDDPDPVPPPVVVPSEPTYRPNITQTENGTVSTSPSYPEKDDKVTITATPEEGYKVGTVTVVDKNGNPVQVSSEGNGKYSYQQPEGSVTITVDFV